MSSSLLNRTPLPSERAIFPSTLIAALMMTRGRTPLPRTDHITTFWDGCKFHLAGRIGGPGDSVKAHLVHTEEQRFRAQGEGAPAVLFDAGDRGTRRGPSPMQATLLAAMACTASDVV